MAHLSSPQHPFPSLRATRHGLRRSRPMLWGLLVGTTLALAAFEPTNAAPARFSAWAPTTQVASQTSTLAVRPRGRQAAPRAVEARVTLPRSTSARMALISRSNAKTMSATQRPTTQPSAASDVAVNRTLVASLPSSPLLSVKRGGIVRVAPRFAAPTGAVSGAIAQIEAERVGAEPLRVATLSHQLGHTRIATRIGDLTSTVEAQAQMKPMGHTEAEALAAQANEAPVSVENGVARISTSVVAPPQRPSANNVERSVKTMGKIIKVPDLTLPSLDKPLPHWMQAASVRVDRLESSVALPNGASNGAKGTNGQTKLAQNTGAPPVRNPGTPVTNSDRLSNQIEVAVSTFVVLLTTTDLQTVAVADPNIADVAVVNSRAVLLNGKTSGVTSLVIVDGQKIRQYSVRVLPEVGTRSSDIADAIGLPGISVRQVRDSVVLDGEVGSTTEASRAEEIAKIYSPKVINQLTVRGGISREEGTATLLADLIGLPGITVRTSGETVILSGTVDSPQQMQDAETIARTQAKEVLNLLRLPQMSATQVREALGASAELPVASGSVGEFSVPDPLVVREAGGQIILEGTVTNQAEADLALATANRSGLSVVNRLQVRPATSQDDAYASRVANAIGRPGVRVRGTPQRTVLEGFVADTNEAVLVEQVARGFIAPGLGQVDNLLRIRNPIQVNVDVSIVELNRNDSRNLGVQFGSASLIGETRERGDIIRDGNDNPILGPGGEVLREGNSLTRTIDPAFVLGSITAGNGFVGNGPLQILDAFRARLQAIVQDGRGRVLSNPRMSVLSGRTATFQVGGQVPIPGVSTISAAGQTTSITFKDYGILLDVVPNALPSGVVTLRIRTEVSQPDFSVGVTPPGGGSPVPGFRRRSTVTEVTVPPGGVLALSGLITSEEVKNETRVPILSKIPIIGALFKSKEFRNNQTELVVFVQPRVLPNPLPEGGDAYAGVVAVGNNTNVATQLGNPGLNVFEGGGSIIGTTGGAQ